jgi:hypothetical protein
VTCGIGILRILPVYFVRLVFPSCLFSAARVAVSANGCLLKQLLNRCGENNEENGKKLELFPIFHLQFCGVFWMMGQDKVGLHFCSVARPNCLKT